MRKKYLRMKNLGRTYFKEDNLKTITKIALLFFITVYQLFASLTARVDTKSVELGDIVTYSLDISGQKIKKPDITRLCNSDVISTSSQTNMQIINGAMSKSYTLSYKFSPEMSCKIEPIELEIDGKVEHSQAIDIEVKAPSQTKDANFMLTLSSNKEELYVGETLELTLAFKQRNGAPALDSKFTPPELKGFWIRGESTPQKTQDDNYTTTTIVYTLLPQRVGELKISRAQMQIASRDNKLDSWGGFMPTIKWKNYFSNELSFNVKPLPEGVTLVGDFKINLLLEKDEVNANEALNAVVEVSGDGNLEDIKSFKPYIDAVGVFEEKAVIEGSKLSQKIAFVAQNDFVIPPFEIKYFDIKTKEIKSISTKEVHIKIINAKPKEELIIKTDEKQIAKSAEVVYSDGYGKTYLLMALFAGVFLGVILMLLKPFLKFKRVKKSSIKEPRTLLAKLLPYKEDEEVKEMIEALEQNIYTDKSVEIDKKALRELLKRLKIG